MAKRSTHSVLTKSPTGIAGLDEILGGGIPKGRPTLVCGAAGCGKTLVAMEFLVRGATKFGEPGVFMAFEENAEELTQNVASLGFDLTDLAKRKKVWVEHVHLERSEIEVTGEFDLEALFIRLGYAIDLMRAKRVVLDTIESMFSGLPNPLVVRAELRRLFRWLKDRGVTAMITAERGDQTLTRHGLEEYVSDCVILLDHHISDQIATRRLRVAKYRGSAHGTNEYPFLIDAQGISVLPITSLGLQHTVSAQRISTGIPALDAMLGGKGYYRGSTVLVSGSAGSAKSSVAAHFSNAACRRGERVLYFTFEESPDQMVRNMRSIGLDLQPWIQSGLLQIQSTRPTHYGLERHLTTMHSTIEAFRPRVVVVDSIDSLLSGSNELAVHTLLMRLIDFLKLQRISVLLTTLNPGDQNEPASLAVSSLVDCWLLLRRVEQDGAWHRALYVLKSRGMAHSNRVREFLLTDQGVVFRDVAPTAALAAEHTEAQRRAALEPPATGLRAKQPRGRSQRADAKRSHPREKRG